MTYQEELELKNKLTIAEFGIQTIIDMCETRIDHYVKNGKDGTAVAGILEQAEMVQKKIQSKPGKGS